MLNLLQVSMERQRIAHCTKAQLSHTGGSHTYSARFLISRQQHASRLRQSRAAYTKRSLKTRSPAMLRAWIHGRCTERYVCTLRKSQSRCDNAVDDLTHFKETLLTQFHRVHIVAKWSCGYWFTDAVPDSFHCAANVSLFCTSSM